MDSIDDFEMRPITQGLGFNKRPVNLKDQTAKAGVTSQGLRRSLPTEPPRELLEPTSARSSKEIIAELHEALRTGRAPAKLSETLPREITDVPRSKNEVPQIPISPIDKIKFEIPEDGINDSTSVRRGASDNLIKPLTAVPVSFSAIFLDGIIVMAISLVFLVALILVTEVDVFSVVVSAQAEFATQLSLAVLYFAVYGMYSIVARSFFGRSIGEWTYDLQLGENAQIVRSYYPALVMWRTLLNAATGFLTLPILSALFRKDIAASLTGLQLFRRNE